MIKKILILLGVIIIGVLSYINYLYLPDMVVIQVNLSGQATNSISKIFAVGIPCIMSIIGATLMLKNLNKKSVAIYLIGFIWLILNLIFNK